MCIGLLSKSRGHVLRIAAVIHILGFIESPDNVPMEISENAVKAAINIVKHSCQQTAFIAGRQNLEEEIANNHLGENFSFKI